MQLLLVLLALVAGAYGILQGNLVALVIAACCTLLSASGLLGSTAKDEAERMTRIMTGAWQHQWMLVMAAAVGLAGVAAILVRQNQFNRNSDYLWLFALLLVLLGGWMHDRSHSPAVRSEPVAAGAQTSPPGRDWNWLDWTFAGLLTLLALALRLYRLSDFLPSMHGDEGEMGMLALLALHGPDSGLSPQHLPLFSTAFMDHPTLFHYVQAGAMLVFGETLTGLRILSAIVGALCAPLLYGVGRIGWGRAAGLAAGWLMSVSHLHIQYSRIALNNIESVWFMILLVLLLFLARKSASPWRDSGSERMDSANAPTPAPPPRLWLYVLMGLVLGLSQYFYYGSRLLLIFAAPLLLFLWWEKRIRLVQVLALAAALAVSYGPLAAFYSKNIAAFLNRTQGVNAFTLDGLVHELGPQARWPHDIPDLFWLQLTRNANFFVKSGDRSAFYLADLPAFDPVTVLLFWLGLGVVLARFRWFYEFALITWLGLGLLLAGVITRDPPNGPRLILVVPVVYVIAGVFIQRLYNMIVAYLPMPARWSAVLVSAGIAVATFYLNCHLYFGEYAHQMPNLVPISIAHEMVTASDQYRSYLFGAPQLFVEYGVLRFVAGKAEKYNIDHVDELPPLARNGRDSKGLLVFALPHRLADLDQMEARYPGGTRDMRYDALDRLLYATYKTKAAAVSTPAAGQGTKPSTVQPDSPARFTSQLPVSPLSTVSPPAVRKNK